MPNITDAALSAAIAELQADLQKSFQTERERLAKAAPPEMSASASAAPQSAEGDGSPAASPTDSGPTSPDYGDASVAQGEAGDAVGSILQQIEALSPEQLQEVLAALQQMAQAAGPQGAAGPAGAQGSLGAPGPQAPPGPPPEAVAAQGGMQKTMAMGYTPKAMGSGVAKAEAAATGEARLSALEKSVAEVAKSFEVFSAYVQGRAGAPLAKSVNAQNHAPSAAPASVRLTREQILAKLNIHASNPTLAKTDRSAINAYATGRADVSAVTHLLK